MWYSKSLKAWPKQVFVSAYTFLLSVWTTFFRLREWGEVALFYYPRCWRFIGTELLLGLHYLFRSPHRISKAFQKKRGAANLYTYGETPLTTLDLIAQKAGLLAKDTLIELGCGSGRSCFWFSYFVRCRVIGIEYVPSFITKAQRVQRWMGEERLEFRLADMFEADLKEGSVVYLYGTLLSDEEIHHLLPRFKEMKGGSRVVTVSYPLTDYCEEGEFRLLETFEGRFPWGTAFIFLQERCRSALRA